MRYVVSWSIEIDDESADSPEDAAEQAWGMLDDALNHRGAPTVLVVRTADGDEAIPFDMAYVPPIVLDRYGKKEED